MAYDITLVEVDTNVGGWGVSNTDMGFGTDPFNCLVVSMWSCLPTAPGHPEDGSNGGPAYTLFVQLNAGDPTVITLGSMSPAVTFFSATYNTPISNLRSHHLLSVNCATQTVQYYVNDVAVSLISGGWSSAGQFHITPTANIWDAYVGSSLGVAFPAFADLWVGNTTAFVDLTIKANRRKFINGDLTPVYLGTDGSIPFGFVPQIYQTILPGGVPNDWLLNRGTGIDFALQPPTTLSFQSAGACTLPPAPPPPTWAITSDLQTPAGGAVGDVWMNNSYVNFNDPTVRNQFQQSNGSWQWLGAFGQLPTGNSPLDFLTVQGNNPPSDILTGYGQEQTQSHWTLINLGTDPTTGLPYAAMSFDLCEEEIVPNLELTDLQIYLLYDETDPITLRWSDSAGETWSDGILKSMGRTGEYFTSPTWYRIGMSRNRIFELSWSGARATALIGVFIDFQMAAT